MSNKSRVVKIAWLGGAIVFLLAATYHIYLSFGEKFTLVAINGIHHLGKDYSISSFYLDDQYSGNVPREGDGGVVCCVNIPVVWRSDLTVNVRWAVTSWKSENIKETSNGNYQSIKLEKICRARILVERYSKPGRLYVYFLQNEAIRIISADSYSTSFNNSGGSGGPQISESTDTKCEFAAHPDRG